MSFRQDDTFKMMQAGCGVTGSFVKRNLMLVPFLLMLILVGCSDRTPSMAEGLPKTFAPNSPEFDMRVKERFPVGSNESLLIEELQNEQFKISFNGSVRSATFKSHSIACGETWVIQWTTDNERLRKIDGSYRQVCF